MFWHRRKNRDQDLDRELRSHLALEAEEQRQELGLSPDQARHSARRALGNATCLKEDVRESWGFGWLERFAQDVGYGIRTLRKSPAFTAMAAGTLALAIGANTAIFSVIEAVLFRPLPYRDPSRLVLLSDPRNPDDDGILYSDFESWRSHSRSFIDMAIYYRDSGWSQVTLTGSSNEPQTAQGAFVSANFFSVLGVSPIRGRSFTAEEVDRREHVVLLSHELWISRFGSSPDVIGQALRVDGVNSKIVGVMPAAFDYPGADSAFWAPISTNPHWNDPALLGNDPNKSQGFYARWQAVGRLRSGISPSSAQNELNSIAKHLQETSPNEHRASGIAVVPLHVHVTGDTRLALALLFAAVCLVLLIACTNVSNLVLARGAARQRELSLRSALGASRVRILRQLFTENLTLAIFSASLGVILTPPAIRALIVTAPPGIPRLDQTRIDGHVLMFTLTVAILSAILFGVLPAWKASRSDPVESIKGGTGTGAGATRVRKVQKSLAVAEFALALILLAGAGLLLRSFFLIRAVNPGFRPQHVLTMHITLPPLSAVGRHQLLDELTLARLRTLPGVLAAGAIHELFSAAAADNFDLRSIEGRPPESRRQWTPLAWTTIRGITFKQWERAC